MSKKIIITNDTQIKNLPPHNDSYVVMGGIGLSLLKKGNTCRFIGRYKGKNYTLGSTNKGMKCKDAIAKWIAYKNEPDVYLQKKKSKKETTIKEVFDMYFDYYQATKKKKSWLDRKNKLDKMVTFLGADCPVTDFYITNGGREKLIDMQEKLFYSRGSYYHAKRSRGVLKNALNYAASKGLFELTENPAILADEDENRHISKGNPFLTWDKVPQFLIDVSENNCSGDIVVNLALKAHLLMCSRVGWVSRLEWSWFNEDKNYWVIPSQTPGLKNLLNDHANDFIVPSTPVLDNLFSKIREINGWQKYCFKSYFSDSHIVEESINNHIKNLGYSGKQNAHGWRNVVATYGQEVGGFDRDIIDRCLGHSPQNRGSMGHYDFTQFIEKRREFLNWWTNELVERGLKL